MYSVNINQAIDGYSEFVSFFSEVIFLLETKESHFPRRPRLLWRKSWPTKQKLQLLYKQSIMTIYSSFMASENFSQK